MKKVISFIIFVIIFLLCNKILILADETNCQIINSMYNINEDFSDDEVIVSLKPEYSEINKMITASYFERDIIISKDAFIKKYGIDSMNNSDLFVVETIEDLTYLENPNVITKPNDYIQIFLLKLYQSSKQKVLEFIVEISKSRKVLDASPNYNYGIIDLTSEVIADDNINDEATNQWALDYINIYDAWNLVGNGQLDEKIKVGILDGGIQSDHPDLDFSEGNFVQSTFTIPDHGTHIAGIIGAIDNDYGVTGVAQVSVVPLRNVNSEYVADSIRWAIENEIRILNMSFSLANGVGNPINPGAVVENQIHNFELANGIIICAAGNNGKDIDQDEVYPACYANKTKYPNINNVIAVGGLDIEGKRMYISKDFQSNYGINSVSVYAPGKNIYSTLAQSKYGLSSGTSMAAPHVTGVAALLLSINSDLTSSQIVEAIIEGSKIETITTPDYEIQSVKKLDAYGAVKYTLENFSNYNYDLNEINFDLYDEKNVESGKSYFNDKNGFYKLNVTVEKKYNFLLFSQSSIEARLLDSNFNDISFIDLDSSENYINFQKNLEPDVYYLKVKYQSEYDSGIITTHIVLNNFKNVVLGENNILNDTNYLLKNYQYFNNYSKGFYELTLSINTPSGIIIYPDSCIKIYNDSSRQELLTRLENSYYILNAQTRDGSNNLIVFLEHGGTYYIDIDFPIGLYSSASLSIQKIEDLSEVNMFNYIEDEYEEEVLLNNDITKYGDYIQKLEIKQNGNYTISYEHNGNQSNGDANYIYYAFYKEVVGPPEEKGNVEMILPVIATTMGGSITFEYDLAKGIYYIGYYNKLNYSPMTISIKYNINIYDENKIITDPDSLTECGSMINIYEKDINNKSYRGKTIVIGFTRILYLDPILEIDTRTDYSWYSSDDNIATVSEFGTIFAKSPGTVKIMAVNKKNLKILYAETFTIIDDASTDTTEKIININDVHSVNDGDYLLGLTVLNCPYPSVYLYRWEILSYDETITRIEYIGSGYFAIEGYGNVFIKGSNYAYNKKYSVVINLNVI